MRRTSSTTCESCGCRHHWEDPPCDPPMTAEEQWEMELWQALQDGHLTQEEHDLLLAEGRDPRDDDGFQEPEDREPSEYELDRMQDRYERSLGL